MDQQLERILNDLDQYFASGQTTEVEPFLIKNITLSLSDNQADIALALLNELIGYYRSVTRYEDAIVITKKANELVHHMGLQDTISHATTLLNGATAYRSAGEYDVALAMYHVVERIYHEQLD